MADRVRIRVFSRSGNGNGAPAGAASTHAESDDPQFAEDWNRRLERTPHANFSMSLEYLARQAELGEPSRAVLIDDERRHGAMVLREGARQVVCGYPWRWQFVIEGADPADPHGMTADDARWFFAHANRLRGPRSLRFYSPHPLPSSVAYLAATTVLIDLAHTEEKDLMARLHSARRSLWRRSEKAGYRVVDGDSRDLQKRFGAVAEENNLRRHGVAKPHPSGAKTTEEASAEWSEPWHWLLVAVKDDDVGAGLGLGRIRGGMLDARAAGATETAMKIGVNSQVWGEALRLGRLAGHTWMNLGGSTIFKRQFGGTLVPIHCHLSGPAWSYLPHMTEKLRSDGLRFAVDARNRMRTLQARLAARSKRKPERPAPRAAGSPSRSS